MNEGKFQVVSGLKVGQYGRVAGIGSNEGRFPFFSFMQMSVSLEYFRFGSTTLINRKMVCWFLFVYNKTRPFSKNKYHILRSHEQLLFRTHTSQQKIIFEFPFKPGVAVLLLL